MSSNTTSPWLDGLAIPRGLRIFDGTCGRALALEHTGDPYACDHYMEPRYHLGNVGRDSLPGLVTSQEQRALGIMKARASPSNGTSP